MVEKIFITTISDGQSDSLLIGLSGIVKRIKIFWNEKLLADADYYQFVLGPLPAASISIQKAKWIRKLYNQVDGAPAVRLVQDTKIIEDCNFYVDKFDYLVINNSGGATATFHVTFDIVPVSDKTRLYLGGEYHNQ